MSRDMSVDEIQPNPGQPRQHFDEESLRELARSIEEVGQLTPVLVRPVDGHYELVHGERRWRACKLAGLETVRAEVREMDDDEAYTISVIENEQRDDLSPVEVARALKKMMDAQELTQAGVAGKVGKSRSWVAQKLRLLDLPQAVQEMALTENHSRQLLKLRNAGKEEEIGRLAAEAVDKSWSVSRLQVAVDTAIAGCVAQHISTEEMIKMAFWAGVRSVLHFAQSEETWA